ncbi:hypothetical protein HanXRQr2_Chr14g0669261 [Helianthus annuus]|uniref:Uncharacterized protein n=1 Tax=Helianthus annuus TaxID=4232 RepID=A0A9K3EDV1_HELAN|nr:hypothetical protein HanXRQr2_Chr14g0669261 [Helianthus annuus]
MVCSVSPSSTTYISSQALPTSGFIFLIRYSLFVKDPNKTISTRNMMQYNRAASA